MSSDKHEFLILGSPCARTMVFAETVREVLSDLKLDADVKIRIFEYADEKDPMLLENGLEYRCRVVYCPGCSFHPPRPDTKFLPALMVDGKLLAHSGVPADEDCKKAIKAYLGL